MKQLDTYVNYKQNVDPYNVLQYIKHGDDRAESFHAALPQHDAVSYSSTVTPSGAGLVKSWPL